MLIKDSSTRLSWWKLIDYYIMNVKVMLIVLLDESHGTHIAIVMS